jgi:hypothetical protein
LDQFNVTIGDDKHVSSELKRSLEGRLPQPEQPVTLEIQMETLEVLVGYLLTYWGGGGGGWVRGSGVKIKLL